MLQSVGPAFAILTALVAPSLSQVVSDYRIPVGAKVADFDNPASVLAKLTKFKITGDNKATDVYDFQPQAGGKFQSIVMKINDKSIFKPNNVPQNGFRRNDLLPVYDPKVVEKGKKAYHHSIKLTKNLNNAHGYLLASVEIDGGRHIYDIHYGTPFDADNTAGKAGKDADFIRVRDINFKELFSVKMQLNTVHNFAIEVDWDKDTLSVYHSTEDQPLAEVRKTVPNKQSDGKSNSAGKGEWHIQLIKEPLPDPSNKKEDRNNVSVNGIQEKGINEEIMVLRNFVEDTSKTPLTKTPDGPAAGATSEKTDKQKKPDGSNGSKKRA